MLFDAVLAVKQERVGMLDLNSRLTVRQMKAVPGIAAGSPVWCLLSAQDLRFAPRLMISPRSQLKAACGVLGGFFFYFFYTFCYLTVIEMHRVLLQSEGQLGDDMNVPLLLGKCQSCAREATSRIFS